VPLIGVGPKYGPPGSRNRTVVSTLDVFATVCDLAAAQPPPGVHGRSLLATPAENDQPTAYIENNFFGRAIVTDRFNFVTEYIPNVGQVDPPRSATNDRGREQLFDLEVDAGEVRNLASRPDYADVIADMRRRLIAQEQKLEWRPVTTPMAVGIATDYGRRVRALWESDLPPVRGAADSTQYLS
jgi:arylsulfatase A-like enzyme